VVSVLLALPAQDLLQALTAGGAEHRFQIRWRRGGRKRAHRVVRRRDCRRADGDARGAEGDGGRARERRRAATSRGCRHAAGTPLARLRRAMLPDGRSRPTRCANRAPPRVPA
jgi:hypothetical protein